MPTAGLSALFFPLPRTVFARAVPSIPSAPPVPSHGGGRRGGVAGIAVGLRAATGVATGLRGAANVAAGLRGTAGGATGLRGAANVAAGLRATAGGATGLRGAANVAAGLRGAAGVARGLRAALATLLMAAFTVLAPVAVAQTEYEIWSATMTVEYDGNAIAGTGYIHYQAFGVDYTEGSLDDDDFDIFGTAYTVTYLYNGRPYDDESGPEDTFEFHVVTGVSATLTDLPNHDNLTLKLEKKNRPGEYWEFALSERKTPHTTGIYVKSASGGDADTLPTGHVSSETVAVKLVSSTPVGAGQPVISGMAQVGQVLTATQGSIFDPDGLENVVFSYQWLRVDLDGESNPETIGEDSDSYTLTAAEEGKKIKVRFSFRDDANNDEERTSGAYPDTGTVGLPLPPPPLPPPPEVILISNIGQTSDQSSAAGTEKDLAQGFTTGNNPRGYDLTGIDIRIELTTSNTLTSPTVKLRAGDPRGPLVATTLSYNFVFNPDELGITETNNYPFVARTAVRLAAATTYYVVIEGGSDELIYQATTDTSYDSRTLPGWRISNTHHSRDDESTGAFTSGTGALQIGALGSVVDPPPPVVTPPLPPMETMVSNFDEMSNGEKWAGTENNLGQSFSTGSNEGGYLLTGIDFKIRVPDTGGPHAPPTIVIRVDGETITLTGPASFATHSDIQEYRFSAPPDTRLIAEGAYGVVIEGGSNSVRFSQTNSAAEDDIGPGDWHIGNDGLREDAGSDGNFNDILTGQPFQIRVHAIVLPPPSAAVLVSNINQVNSNTTLTAGTTDVFGNEFRTGNEPNGYELRGIDLRISNDIDGSKAPPTVVLRRGSVTGTAVATLTGPVSITGLAELTANYTFSAPPNTYLAAATNYHVFIEGGANDLSYRIASSHAQDSDSLPDWRIANNALYRSVGSNGNFDVEDGPLMFRVNGIVRPDPGASDTELSALALTEGTTTTDVDLSPDFAGATREYRAWVANDVASVTLTATKNDANATVMISGDRFTGTPDTALIDLREGRNPITVTVTAEDGETADSYAVVMAREASAPAPDPMALLSANVTVGENLGVVGYYKVFNPGWGAMTDTDFVVGGSTYRLWGVLVMGDTGVSAFAANTVTACFTNTPAPPTTAVRNTLVLNIGGHDFPLAGTTLLPGANTNCYSRSRSALTPWAWGDVVTVKIKESGSNATGAPVITGSGRVDATLTATTDNIDDPDGPASPAYRYQWLRMDGATETIVGTDAATYVPVEADRGREIKVRVSFTDDDGNAETLTSAAVRIRAASPPATCAAPTLTGRTQIWDGTVMVASQATRTVPGSADTHGFAVDLHGDGTYGSLDEPNFEIGANSYTVLSSDVDTVTGELAVGLNRALTDAERRSLVLHVCAESYAFAEASASDFDGVSISYSWPSAGLDWSAQTGVTLYLSSAGNAPATGRLMIDGMVAPGQVLTAVTSGIGDPNGLTAPAFSYQWIRIEGRTETDIPGATTVTYTPVADAALAFKVRVGFSDDAGHPETLESAAVTGTIAAITIAPDRTRATGKFDWIHYRLTRRGTPEQIESLFPVLVGVNLEPPAGNDWGIDILTHEVTFDTNETTKTLSIRLNTGNSGSIGFDDTATTSGTLVTSLTDDLPTYNTDDTAEVKVVVLNPSWIVKLTETAYRVAEGGGARTVALEAYAASAAVPPPSQPPGGGALLRARFVTVAGTAASGSDYNNKDPTIGFPASAFRAGADGIQRARRTVTFTARQDTVIEGDETLSFRLSRPDTVPAGVVQVEGADGRRSSSQADYPVTLIDDDLGVLDVAVTSMPVLKSDDALTDADTYGDGDKIRFTVTFSTAVAVTGDPHFEFKLGPNGSDVVKPAALESGRGTNALVFAYPVQPGDVDADGIRVGDQAGDQTTTIRLDSGESLRNAASPSAANAVLTHTALGTLGGHKVNGARDANGQPLIEGEARVGQTLTATAGDIRDSDGLRDPPGYTYQWLRLDGTDEIEIETATMETYVPVADDIGKPIKVRASFTDARDNAETRDSDPTAAVAANAVPVFPESASARMLEENPAAGAAVGEPVAATDADDDTLTYTFGGTDKDSFDFDTETGQITTRADVIYDFEASKNVYAVTVTASDGTDETGVDVTITLTDAPALSVAPAQARVLMADGAAGFEITAAATPAGDLSVAYTVEQDEVWFGATGTATYAANDDEWTQPRLEFLDNAPLQNGTATLTLLPGAGYDLGTAAAKVEIVAADPLVTLRTAKAGYAYGEFAGTATVTLTAETIDDVPQPANAMSVNWSTTPDSATGGGADFTDDSGTVTFAAADFTQQGARWVASKNVEIILTNDGAAEPTERFYVTLTRPAGLNPLIKLANADGTLCRGNEAGVHCGAAVVITDDDHTGGLASVISGTARVGETLTVATYGLSSAIYSYQWLRVDLDGASNPVDIPGASADAYTLTAAEEGKKIKVRLRYTDAADTVATLTSEAYPDTGTVGAAPFMPPIIVQHPSAGVLLSNLGQDQSEFPPITAFTIAGLDEKGEAFITGRNPSGYSITSIELLFNDALSAADINNLEVKLLGANVIGTAPTNPLFTFTNPASIAAGTAATFTAPDGSWLAADTGYFVSLKYRLRDSISVTGTSSGNLDAGHATGWNLPHTALSYHFQREVWDTLTSRIYLRVNGAVLAASVDTTLSALALTGGSAGTEVALSPAFASDVSDYRAWVTNDVATVTLAATKNHAGATVVIAGDVEPDTPDTAVFTLREGANPITVTVTAEDGVATETYTVIVAREASAPAPDPMALLTARLTAGAGSNTDRGGDLSANIGYYRFASTAYGALTGNDFVAGDATYRLRILVVYGDRVSLEQSYVNRVLFCFHNTAQPSDDVRNTLVLRIDSHDFTFAGSTPAPAQGCYLWTRPSDLAGWAYGDIATVKMKVSSSNATGAPAITGSGRVGETLTAATDAIGDPDGLSGATFSYQWLRMGGARETAIGTGAATYMPVDADEGKQVKVRVSFTDDATNAETLTSAAVSIRAMRAPAACAVPEPTLTGRTQIWRDTLTVAALDVGGTTTGHGYDTIVSTTPVGSLPDSTFEIGPNGYTIASGFVETDGSLFIALSSTLTEAEAATLVLHVCGESYAFADAAFFDDGENSHYDWPSAGLDWSSVGTRTLYLSVRGNIPAAGRPMIYGTPVEGRVLTAATTAIDDQDGLTDPVFSYQWLRFDGATETPIPGATTVTYTPTAADASLMLKVRVGFTDDAGNPETLVSASALVDGLVPAITIAPDRPKATGRWDWIHYTLARQGETAAALTVTVTLEPPAGNDWNIPDGTETGTVDKLNHQATFPINEPTTTLSILLQSTAPGAIGFSTTATTSGRLVASLSDVTGYTTTDKAAVEVVTPRDPPWIFRYVKKSFSFPEGSGARMVEIEAAAVSAAMPGPSEGPNGGTGLSISVTTDAGTATIADYTAVSVEVPFPAAAFSADANGIQRGRTTFIFTPTQDRVVEADETLSFQLTKPPALLFGSFQLEGPDGNRGAANVSYPVTIIDDDIGVIPGGVAVISTPTLKSDDAVLNNDTYGAGDRIRFQVTFNEPVTVTGSPDFRFWLGPDATDVLAPAAFAGGSGTTRLVFAYTVKAADAVAGTDADMDADGIAIGNDPLTFVLDAGEYIRSTADPSVDAVLTHAAPGIQGGHRVDGARETPGGKPDISDNLWVGQTLTTAKNTITDVDGVTRADNDETGYAYTYQWFTVDGTTDTPIPGATSASYKVTAADAGKTIKVVWRFTDDADNAETRPSDPTATVAPNAAPLFPAPVPPAMTLARTIEETAAPAPAGDVSARNIGARVIATDANGDRLTYTLGGTDKDSFEITAPTEAEFQDGVRGVRITTKTGITYDFETRSSYEVTVTASDGTEATTVGVTITLIDLPTVSIARKYAPRALISDDIVYFLLSGSPSPSRDLTINYSAQQEHDWFTSSSLMNSTRYIFDEREWAEPAFLFLVDAPVESGALTVTLEPGDGYELDSATKTAEVGILAADPVITVRAEQATYNHAEDGGTVTVTLRAETIPDAAQPIGAVPVDWSTMADTATGGDADFTDGSGTVTFTSSTFIEQADKSWVATKEVQVAVVDDLADPVAEPTEWFFVTLARHDRMHRLIKRANADGTLCEANAAGVNCGAVVNILDNERTPGSPAAPAPPVATANGATQIDLIWTAPTDTGATPITGYKIEWSADGSTNWQLAAETGSTVKMYSDTDLAPVTTRYYRVTAKNDAGFGSPSAASNKAVTDFIPTLSVADAYATEGEPVEFTVTLDAVGVQDVRVDYATSRAGGTAEAADFTATAGTLTINANELTDTVTVPTHHDTADLDNETFTLTLTDPVNAILSSTAAAATGTIYDDEGSPRVQFTLSEEEMNEAGSGNSVTLTATLTRAYATAFALTLAADPADRVTLSGTTINFPANSVTGTETITLTAVDNSAMERDVTVTLTGSHSETGVQDPAPVTVTVLNDELPVVGPTQTADTQLENAGRVTHCVESSIPAPWPITVHYAPRDGSAQVGEDYEVAEGEGTLRFSTGDTSECFHFDIVDDNVLEPESESFFIDFSVPEGSRDAVLSQTPSATIEISDDDTAQVNITATKTVDEAQGRVTLEVSMVPSVDFDVTVNYATADGAALAGSDYTSTTGTIDFPASATFVEAGVSRRFTIPIINDKVDDDGETFNVNFTLKEGTDARIQLDPTQSVVTIEDDDDAGVTLSTTNLRFREGRTGSYTIRLNSRPTAEVAVAVALATSSDSDISINSGSNPTFTTTDWDTPRTITLAAAHDEDMTNDAGQVTHTVTSTDSNYNGFTVGQAQVTVVDDEGVPDKPRFVLARAQDVDRILLKWREPAEEGADAVFGYKIESSANGSNWATLVENTSTVETRYTETGLAPGTSRHYRLYAINSAGPGPVSYPDAATTPTESPVVMTVTALSASVREGQPARIRIHRSRTSSGHQVEVVVSETGNMLEQDAKGLHYVRFASGASTVEFEAATHQDGIEEPSGSVELLVLEYLPDYRVEQPQQVDVDVADDDGATNLPLAPALTVNAGDGRVTLNWTRPDDGDSAIIGYELRYRVASASWPSDWTTVSGGASARRSQVSGLGNGEEYEFAVRAVNGNGAGAPGTVKTTPTSGNVPATPLVTATAGAGLATLSWSAVSDRGSPVLRYERRHRELGAAWPNEWIEVPGAGEASGDTVQNLSNYQPYEFQLRAVNAAGAGSPGQAQARPEPSTQEGAPGQPSLSVEPGDARVTLTWTAPDNGGSAITRYEHRRRSTGGSWPAQWTTVAGGGSSREDTIGGLTNEQEYQFELRAVNSFDVGPAATRTATPKGPDANRVPGRPLNLTATASGADTVNLAWDAPQDTGSSPITGYRIERSSNGNNWGVLRPNTASQQTTYRDDGLRGGTTRHYRVSARNAAGGGEFSRSAAATTGADVQPVGICDRTPQVRDWIVLYISLHGGTDDCAAITDADLKKITHLPLSGEGIASLRAHDFRGLTEMDALDLSDNEDIGTLPAGIFSGLNKLEELDLSNIGLTAIRPGAFAGLNRLRVLDLMDNLLSPVPFDEFETLAALRDLGISRNPGVERELQVSTTRLGVKPNGSASYRMRLTHYPNTGNTTVSVTSSRNSVTVEPQTLTFNPGNWWREQETTVSAAANASGVATLSHEFGGPFYTVIEPPQVSVIVSQTGAATASAALTGVFRNVPAFHNSPFTFEVHFSEEVPLSSAMLRDSAFTVTNGRVIGARRLNPPGNIAWEITVDSFSEEALTVALPETTDCAATGAICSEDGRPLSARITATVAGPPATAEARQGTENEENEEEVVVDEPTVEPTPPPLTASFSNVPSAHDGSTAFVMHFRLSEEPHDLSYVTVRESVFDVTGGRIERAKRLTQGSNRGWALRVAPSGDGDVTVRVKNTTSCTSGPTLCSEDGRRLAGGLQVSIEGPPPPALSVADATVQEGAGATLAFAVTLDRTPTAALTVDYATADGTGTGAANAGTDYTATSGTLTFAVGESSKTVSVAVLDDSHDEGAEILTLTLSNPSGASIADGTATGTINNTDAMPKGWLSRFGRTSAVQVVRLLDSRFDEAPVSSAQLTLGGRSVPLAALRAGPGGRDRAASAPPPAHCASGADCAPRESDRLASDAAETDPIDRFNAAYLTSSGSAARSGAAAGAAVEQGTELNSVPGQAGGANATLLERAAWNLLTGQNVWQVDRRQFLSRSSFELSLTDLLKPGTDLKSVPGQVGENESVETVTAPPAPAGHWSLWGRGALTRFAGMDSGVNVDGDVLTGLLGLDYARGRWLTGVGLSWSDGAGSYRAANGGGELDSTLLSVHPYLRYTVNQSLSVWGVLGYGQGAMTLTPAIAGDAGDGLKSVPGDVIAIAGDGLKSVPGEVIETDLRMGMGAFGVRGTVYASATTKLALKSDVLWVSTTSAAVDGLAAATGETSRLRLALEGSHMLQWANGRSLLPALELGLRYDDGDAETGVGAELGGRVQYQDMTLGLTVATHARVLLAHEDSGYEEWGLGGSLRLDPGAAGRGASLDLRSSWGAVASGIDGLWSQQTTTGLARGGMESNYSMQFDTRLGYGLEVPGGRNLLTPYGGLTLAGPHSRVYRLGGVFRLGELLELSLDAERRENLGALPDHGVMLRGSMPW